MNRINTSGLLFLLALIVLLAGDLQGQYRRGDRRGGPQLKVGQDAPDFALHPLEFVKDKKGKVTGRIGKKTIKLSDYKGKAPVCLFSSSYT